MGSNLVGTAEIDDPKNHY